MIALTNHNHKLHVSQVRVRYQETDQMGVVHHANYLNWFEVGRTEWLRREGLTYRDIEERGLMLPVMEVQLSYHLPAKYDDLVDIHCYVDQYSGVKLAFAYEIYRESEKLVTGKTFHCWTNKSLRPVSLKRHDLQLHELLMKQLEGNQHRVAEEEK